MAIAGRVAIVPKGDWSADATYKRLDAVTYNNTLYFAKKEVPAGTVTSNTEYWSKSIVGGAGSIATKEDAGIVKPADGLTVAEDGTLKVSIDGTTLTMDQVNNVIKLADTLKDKINGAFPAANLINNLTTTEAGYALDARQGKALDDKITEINGSLNLCVKQFTIPVNKSIAIPCLNCIIFHDGNNGGKYSIVTTVGYASDTVRSRISYINGTESNGLKLSYSEEETLDSKSGIFIIENTNPVNPAHIAVIGIKNFSRM